MARGKKRKDIDVRAALKDVHRKCAKRKRRDRKRTAATAASVAAGKPQPGDRSPWWRPELAGVYAQAPREVDGAVATSTPLRPTAGRQSARSWFSVKSLPLGAATATPWRLHMAFAPEDVWSQEAGADRKAATARKGKDLDPVPLQQMRARKCRIRFGGATPEARRAQERTLRTWMGAYRLTYNRAVKLVNADKRWCDAEGLYLGEQLVVQAKTGRTTRVNKDSTDEERADAAAKAANVDAKRTSLGVDVGALVREHPWLASVPSNIRKDACRDVIKANKSNEAMREANSRHKWTLKYKRRVDASAWTMAVPTICITEATVEPRPTTRRVRTAPSAEEEEEGEECAADEPRRDWTRVTLCPTTGLGDLWLTEALPTEALRTWTGGQGKKQHIRTTIAKDCRLSLDGRGRFYLNVPYEIEPTPPTTKPLAERAVGVIDPGDRVQATVYSPATGEVVQYATGKHRGGKDRIFEVCKAIDATIAAANEPANCDTASKRRGTRKKMARLRARAKNLVTEARNKIVLDMARRWDTLVLPPFESKQMVQRKGRPKGQPRKIHSKVARSLMAWRHYEFAVHVRNLFLRAGKEVCSPDERYTTMTCGACGILNERHSNEEWTCKRPLND